MTPEIPSPSDANHMFTQRKRLLSQLLAVGGRGTIALTWGRRILRRQSPQRKADCQMQFWGSGFWTRCCHYNYPLIWDNQLSLWCPHLSSLPPPPAPSHRPCSMHLLPAMGLHSCSSSALENISVPFSAVRPSKCTFLYALTAGFTSAGYPRSTPMWIKDAIWWEKNV